MKVDAAMCSPKPKMFHHQGFTLLEVLVAVFVAATALLAVWKLHAQVASLVPDIRFQTIAPFLAEKTLAEVDMLPREKHTSGRCEAEAQQSGISCEIQIEWMDDKRWEKLGTSVEQIDICLTGLSSGNRLLMRAYRFYPVTKNKPAARVPVQ